MKILKSIVLAAGLISASLAHAQDFPQKPVNVVFPNAAGGGFHTMLLTMQPMIEAAISQPLAVTPMPGAGTVTGTRFAADQAPDGHTLLWIHEAILQTGAMGNLGFNTVERLQPIARVVKSCPGVFVRGDAEYSTLADLQAHSKSNSDVLRAGVNIGATSHVQMLSLAEALGVDFRLVHVGGGAKARQALLAGDVDLTVQAPGSEVGLVEAGQEKALSMIQDTRHPSYPDILTMKEEGFDVPNAMCINGYFWIRRDADQDVKDFWSKTFQEVFSDPANAKALEETLGVEMAVLTGAELDALGKELWEERSALVEKYGISRK